MDLKLELVLIPVSDVDRAKDFYVDKVGFNMEVDHQPNEDFRVVEMTPKGSACSIAVGKGITDAEPGSVRGTHLVVTDIEAVRAQLVDQGVDVGEVRHTRDSILGWTSHQESGDWVSGADPHHQDYASFADFKDPDGNVWVLQERGYGTDEE
jgi:catechol 2,3-dioxygenase-like lactoylglutathione lyase family enzyme